jgi:hypothetical protein
VNRVLHRVDQVACTRTYDACSREASAFSHDSTP